MADALRQEVMHDYSYPRLKSAALDLISQLRIEQNLLNASKDKIIPSLPMGSK